MICKINKIGVNLSSVWSHLVIPKGAVAICGGHQIWSPAFVEIIGNEPIFYLLNNGRKTDLYPLYKCGQIHDRYATKENVECMLKNKYISYLRVKWDKEGRIIYVG